MSKILASMKMNGCMTNYSRSTNACLVSVYDGDNFYFSIKLNLLKC
jgi:hypothetical protein